MGRADNPLITRGRTPEAVGPGIGYTWFSKEGVCNRNRDRDMEQECVARLCKFSPSRKQVFSVDELVVGGTRKEAQTTSCQYICKKFAYNRGGMVIVVNIKLSAFKIFTF
ncbi:hypothetical protein VPH35_136919 [Triticum aestivum]